MIISMTNCKILYWITTDKITIDCKMVNVILNFKWIWIFQNEHEYEYEYE